MAGPSIKVGFLGDFSKLKAGIADVGTSAKAGGSTLKNAFSPALDALNKSGVLGPFKEALDGVGESIATVKEHIKDIPLALAAAGVGVAGVGVALQTLGSKDQVAHQKLQAAVAATGKAYEDYAPQVEEAIKKQEKFGVTAVDTQDTLAQLTEATGNPAKALSLLNVTTDLATARHESLSEAARQVGLAYNGNTRILKEFGVHVTSTKQSQVALTQATAQNERADKALTAARQHLTDLETIDHAKKKLTIGDQIALRNATDKVRDATAVAAAAHGKLAAAQQNSKDAAKANSNVMGELAVKLKGQASASADSFGGHLRALRARAEDNIATFGTKYGKSLQAAGMAMTGLGTAMKLGQGAMEAAKAAALGTRIELALLSAGEKVTAAATWILNAAMDANPIVLIVLAIVALIAIITLVLVKTGLLTKAWNEMKKVADDVWKFILKLIKDAWNWIKANWPLLLGILTGPFGLALALIWKFHDQILSILQKVWDWIKGAWNTIYDDLIKPIDRALKWIADLPGKIEAYFSSAITWLVKGGKDITQGLWNGLVATWNSLWRWFSGIAGTIIHYFAQAITWLLQAGKNIIQGLWNGNVSTWGALWRWFSGISGTIIRYFGAADRWLYSAGASIMQGAWNGLIAVWNNLWGWFVKIPGALTGVFRGAIGWLLGAGKDVVQGLWNGITSVFTDVAGWVDRNIKGPLVKAIKGAFGISSPSTVMIGIGKQLLAGLVKGFSPGNWLDLAKSVLGGLPAALASMVGKGLIDVAKLPAKALSSLGGAIGSLGGKIGGALSHLFGGGGGGGGGSLGSWISTAMGLTGVPASWAGPLGTIIKFESGGNPKAINLTDINAQHGDPSRGLMQTIGSTFAAYALPGLNKDIFDPVSNIVAGIRYIQSRYGDIFNVPGIRAVLAGGSYVGYDNGGILAPGLTLAMNNTGANEYVSPTPPGRSSPAVYVDKAYFSTEMDVELFMRRAAWVVQTTRI